MRPSTTSRHFVTAAMSRFVAFATAYLYPWVVEKPACAKCLYTGVRLTPCIPGCQAGIALYIHYK